MTCPHCGVQIQARTRAPKPVQPIDPAQLSDRELFAHYKATSPTKDAEFFLNLADLNFLLPHEQDELLRMATEMSGTRTQHFARLYDLQSCYRQRRAEEMNPLFQQIPR